MREGKGGIILVIMVLFVSVLGVYARYNNFGNTKPNVNIFETIGQIYKPVTITGVAFDRENNIKIFRFDFGDGERKDVLLDEMGTKHTSNENISFSINHTYKKGGRYIVEVEVADSYGLASTAKSNVTIYPIADAGPDQVVQSGDKIWLNGTVYVLDGYVGEFIWDCDGDGGIDNCNNAGPWNCKREYISDEHFIVTGWFNITYVYHNSDVIEATFTCWTTIGDDYDSCIITVLPKKNNTVSGDMK